MAINFLNSINLNQNELIKARVENHPNDTAAGTGVEGQLYYDTTLDTLKVYNGTGWVEVGGGVTSFTATDGTFIDLSPNTSQSGAATLTANLSATGTPSVSTFLRGDNTWATPSYYTGWNLVGSSGASQPISSGNTASILGSGVITTVSSATDTLTVSHNNVSRGDTINTVSPAFGGTFEVIDSVTSSAEGHITGVNKTTVTLPANTPHTTTLTGDVTGTGTTSIVTTIASGAVDFAMINPAAVITSGEGLATNDNDTTIPTSASVIDYVNDAIVGGLVYKGAYNAATNTPNLDATPIAGIKTGWTYTVTADGLFFTEQVRVGDVLIAEIDSPTTLSDWTTVQNNIDIATAAAIGLGNVAGTASQIGVAYSNGTATLTNLDRGSSQNIFKNVAVSGQSTVVADSNNDTLTFAAGSGIAITTDAATDTITIANTYTAPTTSYATQITTSGTVTHNLGTLDVIVQLYDTVTKETVHADVVRASTNTVTVTFGLGLVNPIRVLVQK